MSSEIVIQPLSSKLKDDYLQFFDGDAFADNPRWASCYCRFYQSPHHLKRWGDCTGEENRAAVSLSIDSGTMTGYLAYLDGKVVGWCNANLKDQYTALDDKDVSGVGAIVCFIIAKPNRGQGVARQLLQAACDGLR